MSRCCCCACPRRRMCKRWFLLLLCGTWYLLLEQFTTITSPLPPVLPYFIFPTTARRLYVWLETSSTPDIHTPHSSVCSSDRSIPQILEADTQIPSTGISIRHQRASRLAVTRIYNLLMQEKHYIHPKDIAASPNSHSIRQTNQEECTNETKRPPCDFYMMV